MDQKPVKPSAEKGRQDFPAPLSCPPDDPHCIRMTEILQRGSAPRRHNRRTFRPETSA